MNRPLPPTDPASRRDALGRELARVLDEAPLSPHVQERLRLARETALQAAVGVQQTREQWVVAPAGGGNAPRGRSRWASLGLLALALAGLLAVGHSQWMQQVLGLAQTDAALLRDRLPPNAYGDPGFNEYLDEKSESETAPPQVEEETDE